MPDIEQVRLLHCLISNSDILRSGKTCVEDEGPSLELNSSCIPWLDQSARH